MTNKNNLNNTITKFKIFKLSFSYVNYNLCFFFITTIAIYKTILHFKKTEKNFYLKLFFNAWENFKFFISKREEL